MVIAIHVRIIDGHHYSQNHLFSQFRLNKAKKYLWSKQAEQKSLKIPWDKSFHVPQPPPPPFHSSLPSSIEARSPVLQNKMLVPMTTVRPGSTPPQPISLVAQPLPVQNGVQPGSKVMGQHKTFSSSDCTGKKSSNCFFIYCSSFRLPPCQWSKPMSSLHEPYILLPPSRSLWQQQLSWPQVARLLRLCYYLHLLQGKFTMSPDLNYICSKTLILSVGETEAQIHCRNLHSPVSCW